jgi:hypothetical protein
MALTWILAVRGVEVFYEAIWKWCHKFLPTVPLERLQELVAEGVIGCLAKTHYTLMGHIDGRHIATLVEQEASAIAEKLKDDQVDLVLLTPA